MSMQSIGPGQQLRVKSGDAYAVVEIIAEAVVPAGYWLCRDESSGHRRVIAQTALFPIPTDIAVAAAPAVAPSVTAA
jgi:hypothetical protein